MKPTYPRLPDAELEVMKALWSLPQPAPLSELRRILSARCGWEDSTVKTLLRRLCEKGAVLGIRSLGIGSPGARRLPAGYDRARADDQCREFLTVTASVAAEYGIGREDIVFDPLTMAVSAAPDTATEAVVWPKGYTGLPSAVVSLLRDSAMVSISS